MADTKSKRPANTAFKQQRLKAWQPILTPKTVLPTFFILGVVFAPLGGLLLYESDSVSEIVIDYTACPASSTLEPVPSGSYQVSFPGMSALTESQKPKYKMETITPPPPPPGLTSSPVNRCTIQFSVLQDMKPPVFIYYRLTNFYQNHRRYVKSFDSDQLAGNAVPASKLRDQSCKPLATTADNPDIAYYPCGLIANSMFNDTFILPMKGTVAGSGDASNSPADTSVQYTFSEKGIAWPSDKDKYKKSGYTDLTQIRPPPNWASRYVNGLYTPETMPDLSTDEHFMVWMRTAGLPDFRKLYGRNDGATLKAGTYTIQIDSSYNVVQYGGTKALVISTVSFLGGKNPFLGIVYIAVGIVCVVLGCAFTVRHLWRPRKLGDHTYLSWNQQTGATAVGEVAANGDGEHRDGGD